MIAGGAHTEPGRHCSSRFVEQHGPHCPQDVDISIPYHLAIRSAAAIDEFPVIVAPPVSLGFTHYNMGEIGTITLSLETFIDVLCDVSRSIWANGFRRLILLNGHGGNEQPTWAAAMKLSEEDVWPIALTYWNMAPEELRTWSDADDGSIGHGGEWRRACSSTCDPSSSTCRSPSRMSGGSSSGRTSGVMRSFSAVARWRTGDGRSLCGIRRKGERLSILLERLVALCREYHAIDPPKYHEFGSHCW